MRKSGGQLEWVVVLRGCIGATSEKLIQEVETALKEIFKVETVVKQKNLSNSRLTTQIEKVSHGK